MTIYSYSRLGSFKSCPLKFKYAYIDRVGLKRRTVEAFMGSRFHETMERYYGRAAFEKLDAEGLKNYFNEIWDKEWSEEVEVLNPEMEAEDYRKIGLKAIEDYCRRHDPTEEGHVMGIERQLIVDLDGGGNHKLRCIIDRLMKRDDGTFEIHDYKTSARLPTQQDVDADTQLALYEIAVRDAWPEVRDIDLVWHYAAFDQELRSKRSTDELEKLKDETVALIDEIESCRDFEPCESSLCNWCDFQRICPLFAHKFKTSEFGDHDYENDDAQALVNSYAGLDAQKHELSARVKGIEAQQERIKQEAIRIAERESVKRLFGDDHVLNIREDLKVRYPKKDEIKRHDFETLMKGMGIWEEVSDISWTSLKSLAEREGWATGKGVPAELGEMIEVEPIKQVRLAKRKDRKRDE